MSMQKLEIGEFVPQMWPHYRRRGRSVFFMSSRRPALELSEQDIALFDGIDGCRSAAELEEIHPGAAQRLIQWRDAALLELIPSISPPAAPRLVVIEPHMDDAVLSAGGRLLHRRGKCGITILSVVKRSNFTSYLTRNRGALSVEEVTELRQKEAALAAKVIGAESRCLEWIDAPLRLIPSQRWSATVFRQFAKNPQAFVKIFPNSAEVSLLAGQLSDAAKQLRPDELWIPMGLGDHIDHRTTRDACLRMLAESPEAFAAVSVCMYEDIPYVSAKLVGHDRQIRNAFAACGTRLIPMREDISDVFAEKVRLATLYASQFKSSYIEPVLREAAQGEAGQLGKFAEAFYRLEGHVGVPRESDMCRDASGLAALRARAAEWLGDRRRPPRLTVIALPTGHLGRWANDTEFLLSAIPDIDLRGYVAESCAWQAEGGNGKVRFRVVRRGGWVGMVFREVFRFGCPALVLWRGAYGAGLQKRFRWVMAVAVIGAHGLIRCLLPFRKVLFAKSLSDLCGVLAENMEKDSLLETPSPVCETA
jgi:LmbE family N-acetylglucosaminyl deacetylase